VADDQPVGSIALKPIDQVRVDRVIAEAVARNDDAVSFT
jgi:hypothetical protein